LVKSKLSAGTTMAGSDTGAQKTESGSQKAETIIKRVLSVLARRYAITRAELEVVELTIQGLSNKQISAAMGPTPSTIRTHLMNVFRKLTVASRTELAHVVFRELAELDRHEIEEERRGRFAAELRARALEEARGELAQSLQRSSSLNELSAKISETLILSGLRDHTAAEIALGEAARMRALFESLPDALMLFDGTTSLVTVNAVARETLGSSDAGPHALDRWLRTVDFRDLEGRPIAREDRPISRIARGEEFKDVEILVHRANGSVARLSATGRAVLGATGEVLLGVVVVRVVAELLESRDGTQGAATCHAPPPHARATDAPAKSISGSRRTRLRAARGS
jgi:DNA-binding CsgD family transcriptional regulator